jgi:hypothetical protein
VPLVGGLQALAAAGAFGGFPVMAGEFGPGLSEGPSPTFVTPLSIMQEADTLGMGWLAWAWDDGAPFNLTSASGDGQFLLTNGQPTNGPTPTTPTSPPTATPWSGRRRTGSSALLRGEAGERLPLAGFSNGGRTAYGTYFAQRPLLKHDE